jgi:ubiquinone/menaquinone biosynthesis C-methylase UbiE
MTDAHIDSYYKSRFVFNKDREIVWKEIVKFLKPFLKDTQTVLDLGAGYCDFINNVSAEKKIAVDISSELSRYAQSDVKLVNSLATDLSPVEDSSVDCVFSSNLLEHLTDAELTICLSEIKRVLKKGGLFITMQPNYRLAYKTYFDDFTHKKVFSDESLKGFLVSQDLVIVKYWKKFLPFSLKSRPSIIPVIPFLIRAYLHSPIKPFAGQMLFVTKKM